MYPGMIIHKGLTLGATLKAGQLFGMMANKLVEMAIEKAKERGNAFAGTEDLALVLPEFFQDMHNLQSEAARDARNAVLSEREKMERR